MFTVYAQLHGKHLYYGSTFLPLLYRGDYEDGIEGFFTVVFNGKGFVITNYIKA